jgi:DNA-binding MarR family transcriptional regulator
VESQSRTADATRVPDSEPSTPRRRLTGPASAAEGSTETKDPRIEKRLIAKRRQIAQDEQREPLTRRILAALAEKPSTPTQLAKRLGCAKESPSRVLKGLQEEDLVEVQSVPGDGRQRLYHLSDEGVVRLSLMRAFGDPEDVPDPTNEETRRFLRSALKRAVRMRRKTNRLADAADRLQVILDQAEKAGAHDLVVEAVNELATTERQQRHFDEVTRLLERLGRIALGRDVDAKPAITMPALAHLQYGLGRTASQQADALPRADHLIGAAGLYGQLAELPSYGTRAGWRERQAWSLVSLANNLRIRSQLEQALDRTEEALTIFNEIEDPYGRARCTFMLGFCTRLVGDFDGAYSYLSDAHKLAIENGFERFQADAMMQIGDVRRCQGNLDEAREMLEESSDRAARMDLIVTQAFAQSAWAGVEYQARRFEVAQSGFERAHELFLVSGHREGLALNAKRRATVARALCSRGKVDRARVRELIAQAVSGYSTLVSPVGIAACEIELGQWQIAGSGAVGPTVQSLIRRLDDPDQRDLLEKDPWAPHVFRCFVSRLGDADEGLRERTERLLVAAEHRLTERVRSGTRKSVEAVRQVRHQFHRQIDDVAMDEMGGETRVCQGHEALESVAA